MMTISRLLDPGTLSIILALGAPFVLAAIYIVSKTFENTIRHSREVSLKTRMVDAGMSADEIERVVNAGRSKHKSTLAPSKATGKFAA